MTKLKIFVSTTAHFCKIAHFQHFLGGGLLQIVYDPKQVSESLVLCAEPHKKFSRPIQSQTVGCVKHNFWDTSETFLQNRVAKGYEISKIARFARLVA